MLELRAARAQYGLTKPVDLSFEAGAMTAIIGANGAGKTTLLKLLVGHLEATGGQVLLHERALSSFNDPRSGPTDCICRSLRTDLPVLQWKTWYNSVDSPITPYMGAAATSPRCCSTASMDALDVFQWRHRPNRNLERRRISAG